MFPEIFLINAFLCYRLSINSSHQVPSYMLSPFKLSQYYSFAFEAWKSIIDTGKNTHNNVLFY